MSDFTSVTEALEHLVEPCDGSGDWDAIVRRARDEHAPWWRRRRAVVGGVTVAVLLVATPAFGLQRYLLALVHRTDVAFATSPPAPSVIKKQFLDMSIAAPRGQAPLAIAGDARLVGTFTVGGRRRRLFVAPTRNGGYCFMYERGLGGCRPGAGRAIGTPQQLSVAYSISFSPKKQPLPIALALAGEVTNPRAASITVHFADGSSQDIPFVWVSKPIAAGFFTYDIPHAHQAGKGRIVSVTAATRDGRQLAIQTFPKPRGPLRPVALSKIAPHPAPAHALPSSPQEAPTKPLRYATADGVSATTGRNGVVQFTVVGTSRATRLLQGQQASYSCFRLTTEFGIFTVRGDGYSGTFASHVGLVMWRAGGRLDGCEIGGFGGHRWPDTFAGHTPIELAFDAKARAYFANRAAARDLALFVRTARVQKIRHETARRALRDLRAAYGRELAHSAIRIQAVSPDTLRFSERSTAGRLFTVVVTRGRIKKQNLSPFALVF